MLSICVIIKILLLFFILVNSYKSINRAYKISWVQVDFKFDNHVGDNGSGNDSRGDVNVNDGKDQYQM